MNQTSAAEPLTQEGIAALQGVRIIDLSRFIAGPYCSMILGDMGADVLKVETPGKGDPARHYKPALHGRSVYSIVFNRNKRGVGLDLRAEQDKATLVELLKNADVLVENFRPGTMEAMGLGWDIVHNLNPRLIMARISGFGQDGPWAEYPAFDGIAQATGGLMSMTGAVDGPPTVCGTFICDYTAGMYAVIGILGALRARETTGKGQLVDVSLLDSAASLLISAIPEYHQMGQTMTRRGSRDRYSSPTNVYQSSDLSWVYIICGGVEYFPRLVRAMGRPALLDDPRFSTLDARRANWDEAEAVVRGWAAAGTMAEILAALRAADVPCGKVATIDEVATNPQLMHRGQIVEVEDPVAGKVTMQGVTIKLSDTPLTIRRPMPMVGEHTDEVLEQWLGRARMPSN